MSSVCLYFQVHQPRRVKKYRIFEIGRDHQYFDSEEFGTSNAKILKKVAEKSYLPTNALLLDLIKKHPEFKVSFSISGTFLEQCEEYAPEIIESFKKLVDTGNVELLTETYYHSLSFLYSKEEFRKQVGLHRRKVRELFNVYPKVFRNTELIYNNDLAKEVEQMGFMGVLTEGADHIMGWRSPNFVYRPKGTSHISVLLKNYKLSDDIAFRFGEKSWKEYPLTADKFASWVSQVNGSGEVVNLFMDYESFGEHQWADTGIFEFLKQLPEEIYKHPDNRFVTPSEAIYQHSAKAELDIPHFISWADQERDLSAWLSNPMQHDAMGKIYALEHDILALEDPDLLRDWRHLQTSDHFYYMCTKYFSDGDIHKYFSPYSSPYEAFIYYMNALSDLKIRVDQAQKKKQEDVKLPKSPTSPHNPSRDYFIESLRPYAV
jgi:alpha-amylase